MSVITTINRFQKCGGDLKHLRVKFYNLNPAQMVKAAKLIESGTKPDEAIKQAKKQEQLGANMTYLTDPVSECCSAPLKDETFGEMCSDCLEPSGPAKCIDGTELPTDEQGMIVGSFLKAKVLALIVICMVAGAMFAISIVGPSGLGTGSEDGLHATLKPTP